MSLHKIDPSELQIGQRLRWPVYDRNGKLLLRRGSLVSSEYQRQQLLDRGMFKLAEVEGSDTGLEPPLATPSSIFARIDAFERDLDGLHRALQAGAKAYGSSWPERVGDLVEQLFELARIDRDAVLAALHLDTEPDRIVVRYLHVAVLAGLLAERIGLHGPERRALACAAVSFDCGLGPEQRRLNLQQQALTEAQRRLLQVHPERGANLLEQAGVHDRYWLEAVIQHHERIDGSGYPRRLIGAEIHQGARLIGLLDVYTALIRPRAYREAMHSREALRRLFLERGRTIDSELAEWLIKELGVFPPGTLVRLQNHEVCIVRRRGPNAMEPELLCLVRADGVRLSRPQPRDPQQNPIVEAVSYRCCRWVADVLPDLYEA